MKTILSHDGELYHKSCLDKENWENAKAIPADELDDELVCAVCSERLTGDNAPDDSDDVEDDEPEQAP